ncbi:cupin domain-containing protein [Anthocerotibacter panamensis]|uniref:cupin domain-containing protein n=1 Tax=Anthocerotibacter panamensis TaxID=2857077 RepID=UPI001C40810D|nr:cupin domain-containing protein [Anthocerotibacter panamensis]
MTHRNNLERPSEEVTTLRAKVVPPGEGEAIEVLGTPMKILMRAEESGGTFCAYEVLVRPGEGPRPHIQQQEEECFYVLEGQFEFQAGAQVALLGPGSFVFVPRRTRHTFKNVGPTPGRLLGWDMPAGREYWFEQTARVMRNGAFAEAQWEALNRECGVEFVP